MHFCTFIAKSLLEFIRQIRIRFEFIVDTNRTRVKLSHFLFNWDENKPKAENRRKKRRGGKRERERKQHKNLWTRFTPWSQIACLIEGLSTTVEAFLHHLLFLNIKSITFTLAISRNYSFALCVSYAWKMAKFYDVLVIEGERRNQCFVINTKSAVTEHSESTSNGIWDRNTFYTNLY